jgi:hypothetical protein
MLVRSPSKNGEARTETGTRLNNNRVRPRFIPFVHFSATLKYKAQTHRTRFLEAPIRLSCLWQL